jgi:hypothetical protein
VHLNTTPFEVQQDIDDVFLHAVDGRILVQDTGDRDFSRCVAHHGGQQTRRSVAQRVTIAALDGSRVTFGAIDAKLLNVDSFGFNKLVCMQSSSQYLSSLHR